MSENICELCGSTKDLIKYQVEPKDEKITVCGICASSIEEPTKNMKHWHCLNESMWSEKNAVKVVAYRILSALGWQEQLEMLYLEPEVEIWAKEGIEKANNDEELVRDSNGNILKDGDTVFIIKDLPVKGAGFTVKQATTIKNIRSVKGDPTHIQRRVNGNKILF